MSVPAELERRLQEHQNEVDRKVRQLDNDVQSIYGMLTEISNSLKKHGKKLDNLDEGQTRLGGTLLRHGVRLDALDRQMFDLDTKLTEVVATQQRHGNRLDQFDGKLDTILGLLRNGRAGNGDGE